MKEDCRSCSNNLTRNYLTIKCAIWTPKMKSYKYGRPTEDGQYHYRLPFLMRCQYYEKDEGLKV